MKRILILLMICAVIANAFEIKTELEYKSKRISKGKVSNPESVGLINLKIDSGYGLYYTLFGINDWTNYNEAKGIDRFEFERFEHRIGFSWKFNDTPLVNSLKLDVAYIYTDFQEDIYKKNDTEHEVYIKLTTGLPLKPGLKFNYDLKNDYFYINPFISYDWKIVKNLTLEQELNLYFYNSKYCDFEFKTHDGVFTCLYYKAFLGWNVYEGLSIGPLFEAAQFLDSRVRDSWKNSDKNNEFNCLIGFKLEYKY